MVLDSKINLKDFYLEMFGTMFVDKQLEFILGYEYISSTVNHFAQTLTNSFHQSHMY